MTTPTQPQVQPVIEQIQAADLPKLARRLQSVAYSHGMDDQSPYKTDSFYAKADKKSTDALAELLAAIASKEAEAKEAALKYVSLFGELQNAMEEIARLKKLLHCGVEMARDAHAHWDADHDAKVGKFLLAMAGFNSRYDARADAIHAALNQNQGEPK